MAPTAPKAASESGVDSNPLDPRRTLAEDGKPIVACDQGFWRATRGANKDQGHLRLAQDVGEAKEQEENAMERIALWSKGQEVDSRHARPIGPFPPRPCWSPREPGRCVRQAPRQLTWSWSLSRPSASCARSFFAKDNVSCSHTSVHSLHCMNA